MKNNKEYTRNVMKKGDSSPIGIFDSGSGGLSIWRQIVKIMPQESTTYYADHQNCPYGRESREKILEFSIKNCEFLLEKGCKLIVVACNTATAAAIDQLRSKFSIPFVGMEPATKTAAISSQNGKIGILATKGTLMSELFKETKERFAADTEIHMQIGDGLVELVENSELMTNSAQDLVDQYITPMITHGVDHIVLGCTHYPALKPLIEKSIGNRDIKIIDPSPAVARRVQWLLKEKSLENLDGVSPQHQFYPENYFKTKPSSETE